MKSSNRKRPAKQIQPVEPLEIVAVDPVEEATPPVRTIPCVICGSGTQEGSPENMCWVCRRLKISAWREVEQQIPAQE